MREREYAIDDIQWIQYSLTHVHEEERRIRRTILEVSERGEISHRELARKLGVTHRTIGKWIEVAREERDAAR